jgi:hypothetical protein
MVMIKFMGANVIKQCNLPRRERIGVHAGTFHSLTVPDQLPVARISLLGANRTWHIGRSSPICEPRLANFLKGCEQVRHKGMEKKTHFNLCEYFFSDIDYPTKVHSAVYSLLGDALLSSAKANIRQRV